jgi:hypothetical protein
MYMGRPRGGPNGSNRRIQANGVYGTHAPVSCLIARRHRRNSVRDGQLPRRREYSACSLHPASTLAKGFRFRFFPAAVPAIVASGWRTGRKTAELVGSGRGEYSWSAARAASADGTLSGGTIISGEPISIHDNRLVSYTVDGENQRIALHTFYEEQEPHEHTDVIFSGVVAYDFECDNFGTILFDITERPLSEAYASNASLFVRLKGYGWPVVHYDTVDELLQRLSEQQVRGFIITSSWGMYGFVLARDMQILQAPSHPAGSTG